MSNDSVIWKQAEGGAVPTNTWTLTPENGGFDGFGVGAPQYVKLPEELGGETEPVTASGWEELKCPACSAPPPTYILKLANGLEVACCAACRQYAWFKRA